MRYTASVATALAAAALFTSAPASATIFNYTLTGSDTASWSIDDNLQAPFAVDADSFAYVTDVTWNGSTESWTLIFYDDAQAGGITIGPVPYGFLSPQLFTGSTSSPNLITGTFNNLLGFPDYTRTYDLTITADRGVPEPSTWAMMLLGFGAVGMSLRWRRVRAAAEAAA